MEQEYGYSKNQSIGNKKKNLKHKKDKGEQKALFIKIWGERPHVSELSKYHLGDEINVWFFAHILSKGSNPQLKLNPDNIMLVTQDEHWELDQNTHKAKVNPLYKPFFDKAQALKEQYG